VYDRRALYQRELEGRIGKGIHMAIGAGDTTRIGAFEGSFHFSGSFVLLIAAWICLARGVFCSWMFFVDLEFYIHWLL
jgi:hypothetical protein